MIRIRTCQTGTIFVADDPHLRIIPIKNHANYWRVGLGTILDADDSHA